MEEFWETLMECNSQWVLIIHFPSACDVGVWFITWIWPDGSVLKKASSISSHCLSFQCPSSNSHSPLPDNQLCFSIVWRMQTHTYTRLYFNKTLNMSNLITTAYVTKPFFETTSDSLCPQREKDQERSTSMGTAEKSYDVWEMCCFLKKHI